MTEDRTESSDLKATKNYTAWDATPPVLRERLYLLSINAAAEYLDQPEVRAGMYIKAVSLGASPEEAEEAVHELRAQQMDYSNYGQRSPRGGKEGQAYRNVLLQVITDYVRGEQRRQGRDLGSIEAEGDAGDEMLENLMAEYAAGSAGAPTDLHRHAQENDPSLIRFFVGDYVELLTQAWEDEEGFSLPPEIYKHVRWLKKFKPSDVSPPELLFQTFEILVLYIENGGLEATHAKRIAGICNALDVDEVRAERETSFLKAFAKPHLKDFKHGHGTASKDD